MNKITNRLNKLKDKLMQRESPQCYNWEFYLGLILFFMWWVLLFATMENQDGIKTISTWLGKLCHVATHWYFWLAIVLGNFFFNIKWDFWCDISDSYKQEIKPRWYILPIPHRVSLPVMLFKSIRNGFIYVWLVYSWVYLFYLLLPKISLDKVVFLNNQWALLLLMFILYVSWSFMRQFLNQKNKIHVQVHRLTYKLHLCKRKWLRHSVFFRVAVSVFSLLILSVMVFIAAVYGSSPVTNMSNVWILLLNIDAFIIWLYLLIP